MVNNADIWSLCGSDSVVWGFCGLSLIMLCFLVCSVNLWSLEVALFQIAFAVAYQRGVTTNVKPLFTKYFIWSCLNDTYHKSDSTSTREWACSYNPLYSVYPFVWHWVWVRYVFLLLVSFHCVYSLYSHSLGV